MKNLYILFFLFCAQQIFSQQKNYFQQDVRYEIEVSLDPGEHFLHGKEILHYTNNSPDDLNFVWFHLYPNAYKNDRTPFAQHWQKQGNWDFYFSDEQDRGWIKVKKFSSEGKDLRWEYKSADSIDEAKIFLSKPLRSGEKISFEIEFEVKIPETFSRLGHSGRNYAITQWYPKIVVYDREGWHPDSYDDQGEFYGDFGTYDVKITLPENFILDATGEIFSPKSEQRFLDSLALETEKFLVLSEEEKENFLHKFYSEKSDSQNDSLTKTVHFHAENVHDFAWFASEYFFVRQRSYKTPSGKIIPVTALFFPENAHDWQFAVDHAAKTLELYGRWYGEYEYPKLTVVDGAWSNSGGGMEYPMITVLTASNEIFSRTLESYIAHEVGHNWFYGMLGSNERRDAWLDEGVNSFSERRYMEHQYPPDGNLSDSVGGIMQYIAHIPSEKWSWHSSLARTVLTNRDQSLRLRAEEFSDENYGAMVYYKAGFMMYALLNYLGEEKFDRVMKEYFSRWKFRHPRTEDFIDVANEVSQENLSWFFSQWLDKGKYADFVFDNVEENSEGKNYSAKVSIWNKGELRIPVDIARIDERGNVETKKSEREILFESDTATRNIILNSGEKIYETNYLNNRTIPPIKFNWFYTSTPSFTEYDVNLFPFYWYDAERDGHRPEFYLFMGNPYTMQHKMFAYVSYGIASQRLNLNANYAHRLKNFLSNDTRFGLETNQYQGRNFYRVNFSFDWNPIKEYYNFRQKFYADMNWTNIYDPSYYELKNWEAGKHSKLIGRYALSYKTMLYSNENIFSWKNGNNILGGKFSFNRIDFTTKNSFQLTRTLKIDTRAFAGGISGSVPLQERIYLAASNDPDFMQPVTFGRRGNFSPVHNFWIEGDANVRGYYGLYDGTYLAGRYAASANLEFYFDEYFDFETGLFYDAGNVWNTAPEIKFAGLKHDAGIIFRGRLLDFAFPLWVSHPQSGENPWKFRWLMALKFSM